MLFFQIIRPSTIELLKVVSSFFMLSIQRLSLRSPMFSLCSISIWISLVSRGYSMG